MQGHRTARTTSGSELAYSEFTRGTRICGFARSTDKQKQLVRGTRKINALGIQRLGKRIGSGWDVNGVWVPL